MSDDEALAALARTPRLLVALDFDGTVKLIPTPGHTAGHQSLVVRRSDGGQAAVRCSMDVVLHTAQRSGGTRVARASARRLVVERGSEPL